MDENNKPFFTRENVSILILMSLLQNSSGERFFPENRLFFLKTVDMRQPFVY